MTIGDTDVVEKTQVSAEVEPIVTQKSSENRTPDFSGSLSLPVSFSFSFRPEAGSRSNGGGRVGQ